MTLVEALEEMNRRYEMEWHFTSGTVESAEVNARLKLVRDLLELLTSPPSSEDQK